MFIGAEDIRQLLAGYHTELRSADQSLCLTGYQRLDDAPVPYSDHILYVTEDPNRFQEAPEALPAHVLLVPVEESAAVYAELQRYFLKRTGDALFSDSLFQILTAGGSIQEMTERAFRAMQNPVFVFDAGFNLVGVGPEAGAPYLDDYSRRIIENQGFSFEDFQMVSRDRNLHRRVLRAREPVEEYNKALGYSQLLCSVDPDRDLGHIVVNAVNHPFTEADRSFLQIFRMALLEKYRKDEFIQQNQGSHIEYYLKDLLDGKIVTAKRYRDRMDFFKGEFSYNLYCLVVEVARSSSTINVSHICHLFSFTFPKAVTLVHNGQIVVLFRMVKSKCLSEQEYAAAEKICVENGLFAGISNRFTKILHFQDYWRQALRAIELGIETTASPALFRYQDHSLRHIANVFLQKENANIYCHPALKLLLAWDEEHRTELAETLYVWLTCERNTSMTAQTLKIHRNTMNYRMRQINELIQADFDDYREREYLLLSYELRRMQCTMQESGAKGL